ncbi:MAG TPA: hypothetical protein VFB07_10790 [Vicinamibacterales bacterium]|nr:hypothetical protein [Vicinamibacterales bacterium]
MKQESPVSRVWAMWLTGLTVALVVGAAVGWAAGVAVLMVGVLLEIGYVRNFPHLSGLLGFGGVDDVRAPHQPAAGGSVPPVTLYTAIGCPFSAIVRERLEQLRQELWFDLDVRDVTFRPQMVRARAVASVPTVEVGGRRLVGNATSDTLTSFLTGGQRS